MDTLLDTIIGLAIGFIIAWAFAYPLYKFGDSLGLHGKRKLYVQTYAGLYSFFGTMIFSFFFMDYFPDTGLIISNVFTGFGLTSIMNSMKRATA